MTKDQPLDRIWLQAAVAGGSWASIEIIIGSFLHNLQIPFAGTSLTAIAIILLISFYQRWQNKGLIWRAGLICALMKSISPSALILGPMIAIFVEALLMEFAIRLLGGNIIGFAIGGMLTMMEVFFHKIVGFVIIYGFNVVKIYDGFYKYIIKQIGIESNNSVTLIALIWILFAFAGILTALVGYFLSKKSMNMDSRQSDKLEIGYAANVFTIDPVQHYSSLKCLLHLLFIPIGLLLINFSNIYIAVIFISLYIAWCFYQYKRIVNKFKQPVIWIQLLIIVALGFLFLGKLEFTTLRMNNGISASLEMALRAVFVITAFSALSVELRNPVIKAFLFNTGFRKVYMALTLSFGALPAMINGFMKPREFLKSPVQSIAGIVISAENWLEVFEKQNGEMKNEL
jgi:hypothetical protein